MDLSILVIFYTNATGWGRVHRGYGVKASICWAWPQDCQKEGKQKSPLHWEECLDKIRFIVAFDKGDNKH